jgi:N-formylglutamate amidohydrolase
MNFSPRSQICLAGEVACWFNRRMAPLTGSMEAFVLNSPPVQLEPVILTSPHSGRYYPPEFLAASRLDAVAIRRSEDSFVEELFGFAPQLGVPLLAATLPRAFCDLNREPWELDPDMFEDSLPDYVNVASARVSSGLGTIARIVATGEAIYRRKLRFADAQTRILNCWQPYHTALQGLIESTGEKFGACLVIDCHSMPRAMPLRSGSKNVDVVLGDGYGTSCAPNITAFVEASLSELGLTVRRNDPYAGGYITRHYGQPRRKVHILQIELARSLYMDERAMEKNANFAALSGRLKQFLSSLAGSAKGLLATDGSWSLAPAAE